MDDKKRYRISDFRFVLFTLNGVFWYTILKMTAKIWKFTKFHQLLNPKSEKFRQIWLHHTMRHKKFCTHIQPCMMKIIVSARLHILLYLVRSYFTREIIYISGKIKVDEAKRSAFSLWAALTFEWKECLQRFSSQS